MIDLKEARYTLTKSKEIQKILRSKDGEEFFINSSDEDVILLMQFYSSSSYSKVIEKRFARSYRIDLVPPSENRGDLTTNQKYYEFKLSGKKIPSWRHCRPYQNLDGYIFACHDDVKFKYYYMDADVAKKYILEQGTFTQGTNDVSSQNLYAEYDFTYRPYFENYAYGIEDFEKLFNRPARFPFKNNDFDSDLFDPSENA